MSRRGAALEHRTAMTPQSAPGEAAGGRSAIESLPWWIVVGMMVISVAAAPFASRGWALPLVVVPIGLGWIAMQRWMAQPDRATSKRRPGDTRTARRRLVPIGGFVLAAVVWFMVIAQLLMA